LYSDDVLTILADPMLEPQVQQLFDGLTGPSWERGPARQRSGLLAHRV